MTKNPTEKNSKLMELHASETAFVMCYAGIGPQHNRNDRGRWDDVMIDAADALSFFRRLDRLIEEYEDEHGKGTVKTQMTIRDLCDDFEASQDGASDRFEDFPSSLRHAANELASRYGPRLENRGIDIIDVSADELKLIQEEFRRGSLKYFMDEV